MHILLLSLGLLIQFFSFYTVSSWPVQFDDHVTDHVHDVHKDPGMNTIDRGTSPRSLIGQILLLQPKSRTVTIHDFHVSIIIWVPANSEISKFLHNLQTKQITGSINNYQITLTFFNEHHTGSLSPTKELALSAICVYSTPSLLKPALKWDQVSILPQAHVVTGVLRGIRR